MSLTVDASSPSAVNGGGATTDTTAWTPPDNCLLVAFCAGDANNSSLDEDQTVLDSTAVTWTKTVLRNGNGGGVVTVHSRRIVGTSPGSITASLSDNKGSVAKHIFPRVFVDLATGIAPDIGATAVSGTAGVSLTTTVNNSWVWSCGLTANATLSAGSGCTMQDNFGGFDSGDAVFTQSQTALTSTAGTNVTNTVSGTATVPHNVAVEIVPAGAASNYAGPWTGPTPGRIGPTGQWATQVFDTSSSAASIAVADAGTGTEAFTVAAAVALADAGAAVDTLATAAAVPAADTGSAADTIATAAAVALADTGAETEALAVAAAAPLADAGSAAQSLTVTATVALADTGTAADTMVAGIAINPADTGSGADTLGVAAAAPLADTGTATQALTATATTPITDTGSAAESMTVVVTLALADGGSAADTATGGASGSTSKTLADTGIAADTICVCKAVLRPNTGTVVRPNTGVIRRCC